MPSKGLKWPVMDIKMSLFPGPFESHFQVITGLKGPFKTL